jgi:hypothetical protein
MKRKLLLILVIGVSVFFAGCASSDTAESSTVAQSEIYQDYVVDFDNGQMMVTATMRFGGPTGTTLNLTPPSKITYNGLPLLSSKGFFAGTVYRFVGDLYQPNVSFEFTDTVGKAYTNSIGLAPVDFKPAPPVAAKSARLLLPVTRMATEPDVFVELKITDAAGADHNSQVKDGRGVIGFRNSVYFDQETLSIAVEPDFLKDIPAGNIKVSLRVEHDQKPVQATHLGGSMAMKYHPKPLSLTLNN